MFNPDKGLSLTTQPSGPPSSPLGFTAIAFNGSSTGSATGSWAVTDYNAGNGLDMGSIALSPMLVAQQQASDIAAFLQSKNVPKEWVDEAPKIVSEAADNKIDPKLIASVLVVESGGGKHYPKGSHNPFGLLGKVYDSDDAAVHAVAVTLHHHIYDFGQNSVDQLYSGKGMVVEPKKPWIVLQQPAYCTHSSCSPGPVSNVLKQMGGDPNSLKVP